MGGRLEQPRGDVAEVVGAVERQVEVRQVPRGADARRARREQRLVRDVDVPVAVQVPRVPVTRLAVRVVVDPLEDAGRVLLTARTDE